MVNGAGDTATSTEVIPAGHAASTTEDEIGACSASRGKPCSGLKHSRKRKRYDLKHT